MKNKKIVTLILSLSLMLNCIPVCAIENIEEKPQKNNFNLEAKPNVEENSIQLDWTNLDNVQKYQIMQKKQNSVEEFQSISAADLTDENLKINVLQIYPNKGNNLKTWMIDNGFGKDIMDISEITMDDFNKKPNLIKNDDGTWKYDVIVIGCWDNNNRKDIKDNAKKVLSYFIESGRGVVFGHDTLCSTVNPNLRTMAKYVNLKVLDGNWKEYPNGEGELVSIQKTGIFTTYPWKIGEVGTQLTIPYSHNTGQFSNSDIWLKYDNEDSTYNGWNFYLTTYNNCAVINTGHSNGAATKDEQKIFANTIFYTYQLTEKNYLLDHSGQDVASPNLPYITVDTDKRIVYLNAEDIGSEYTYYVKANMKDGSNILSNEVQTSITSGIKGFYYILDNKAFTEIKNVKDAKWTEGGIDAIELEGNSYLHAYAIDNQGNKSSLVHINVDSLPEITKQPTSVSVHNTENKKATFFIEAKGDYIVYQWQVKNGDEWVDIPDETRPEFVSDIITNENSGTTYRCQVSNDTCAIYSDEVSINVFDLCVKIPREINIDGDKKIASYELQLIGDLDKNISIIPDQKITLKLGGATTYATFKYENLKGQVSITTSTSGNWTGFTTFKITYN